MVDGYEGLYRVVDLVTPSGVYTALKYRNWSDAQFEVRLLNLFEDVVDQSTGYRNFLQDDGSGGAPGEATIKDCGDLAPGVYSAYVRTVRFGDEDGSGGLSAGDTVLEVSSTDPFAFELTDEPFIKKLNAKAVPLGRKFRIVGLNFGTSQDGAAVRIGKRAHYFGGIGEGTVLDRVRVWEDGKIVVKLTVRKKWVGLERFVWVEKDGSKSNFKKVLILGP